MDDRYRPRRPRSPVTYNPGRTSLPLNIGNTSTYGGYHLHAVPARQEVTTNPRNSGDRLANPVTTTTYKVAPDVPGRSSSVRDRDAHRHRSSTLDSYSRPVVPTITTTAAPRYRPVIHSAVAPTSNSNQYRHRDEDYYAIPASSSSRDNHHNSHYRHKRYSTMDNSDVNRLTAERDDRLAPSYNREGPRYHASRSRPTHSHAVVRHPDTVADDYGDDGYGYTNPKDLAQYDLEHGEARHYSRSRRDSFEPRSRPTNLSSKYYDGGGYSRSYDPRERGPPPSKRGFDRIPGEAPYDHGGIRMPAAPQPPPPTTARQAAAADPYDSEDHRRGSRRPVSLYQERDHRRPHRDDYYEREDDLRDRFERRHERHDDRYDERYDDHHHNERHHDRYDDRIRSSHGDRVDRSERSDRDDRSDYKDRKDHHGVRDTLLGIAATTLGLNAANKSSKDDDRSSDKDNRSDRDEPKRHRDKEHTDEGRRRREHKEDGDAVDLTGRDPKEKLAQREDRDRAKGSTSPPKDDTANLDLSGRDPKERPRSRDDQAKQEDEPRHRSKENSDLHDNAVDDLSDDVPQPRSRPRSRRESGPSVPFNPKDPMDLKALKEALATKEATKSDSSPGLGKDDAELRPRSSGKDDRGRSADPIGSRQLRVVSPPREKSMEKPIKGILRQPRDKFPEDPMPIREGVAPHKDAKKDGIPPDARWTKISRRLVNPEALERGNERYEARDDFVIVLRVLTKDEVQAYANVTQVIRGMSSHPTFYSFSLCAASMSFVEYN